MVSAPVPLLAAFLTLLFLRLVRVSTMKRARELANALGRVLT